MARTHHPYIKRVTFTPDAPMPREWEAPAPTEADMVRDEIADERAAWQEEQEAEWRDAIERGEITP